MCVCLCLCVCLRVGGFFVCFFFSLFSRKRPLFFPSIIDGPFSSLSCKQYPRWTPPTAGHRQRETSVRFGSFSLTFVHVLLRWPRWPQRALKSPMKKHTYVNQENYWLMARQNSERRAGRRCSQHWTSNFLAVN